MWTLSGFIDEISPDFTEQCAVAAGLGLKYAEVRSAWDINILDLTPEQLATVQETLADHGLAVSSIGSPIGKIYIDEEFGPHLDAHEARGRRGARALARRTSASSRSSSGPGTNPADHRGEVIERMRALARVAEDADVVLLHENEKDIYGDVPSRCLDVVRSVDSPHLRLAWDPANFVQVGRPALHRGVPDAPPAPGVHADQGRAGGRRHGRDRRQGRRRGRRRPSGPCGTTASTGSSRSNRTWAPRARRAPSPAPSSGARPTPTSPSFFEPKGSSTHEHANDTASVAWSAPASSASTTAWS